MVKRKTSKKGETPFPPFLGVFWIFLLFSPSPFFHRIKMGSLTVHGIIHAGSRGPEQVGKRASKLSQYVAPPLIGSCRRASASYPCENQISGGGTMWKLNKLWEARSLLYRSQILQVNTRWKALDEIYKIYMLLHRSDLNISEKIRQTFSHFLVKFNFAKK